jgi:hypothetical protein
VTAVGLRPSWVRIPLPAPRTNTRPVEMWFYLKEQRLRETTIVPMLKTLRILGNLTDLEDPEKVKETILVTSRWSDAFKRNVAEAYSHYAEWKNIPWQGYSSSRWTSCHSSRLRKKSFPPFRPLDNSSSMPTLERDRHENWRGLESQMVGLRH